MNDFPENDVAIFTNALNLPEAARAAYLEQACGSNQQLRRQIEALLVGYDKAGDFLEQSPLASRMELGSGIAGLEKPGDRIGRYKLLRQIGEGGCGVVFLAEQEAPVRRQVALKIIKPGMDTRSVVARFEAERQALALMDHPNIAKIFDAGATESGRPFFVMEFVSGIKITEYCDQNSLTTKERLELFVQACRAIQHAHQKGVIHRDIKPSNILVRTTMGGSHFLVVIDFGIAKATTNQQLTDKTLFTSFEMLVGTPAYMSPEQADLGSMDVDTRTDIYSLGVLLYELLTGSTPFDTRALLKAGLDEVRRTIREKEPARPSTQLSRMTRTDLTAIAQHHKSGPAELIHLVRGDLDWITIKALEKDRTRRYETAYGMSLDIERYLANEPVSARPPGRLYKLHKTVVRNKFLFACVSVVALLLIIGLVVVSISLARERQARREAETSSVKSQQVTKFLENMIGGVEPSVAMGEDTKMLRGILDRTAKGVGDEITNQPAVQAELLDLIGKLYREIGNYKESEATYRTALKIDQDLYGLESKETAESLNNLGLALISENKLKEGETVDEKALAIRRRLFGDKNADTATSLNDLAALYREDGRLAEAESMAKEALAVRKQLFGEENLLVADSLRNLSIILGDQERWAESEAMAREVLAIRRKLLGPEHPWIAASLIDVAWAAGAQNKLDEAESLEREALAMRQKLLGPDHPDVAKSLFLVGDRVREKNNPGEAISILTAALSIQRKLMDEDSPDLLYTLRSLGLALEDEDRWPEAEAVFREELAGWRKAVGNDNPHTSDALGKLGLALEAQDKWSEADPIFREELADLRKRAGDEDLHTLDVFDKLGLALQGEGQSHEEEVVYRESLAAWRKRAGDEYGPTINTMDMLASALVAEGKYNEAENLRRESLAAWREQFGEDNSETLYKIRRLSSVLVAQGKLLEAETLYREELAAWRKKGNEEGQMMYSLRTLGLTLEAESKWPEAESTYREALSVSRKREGNYDPEALVDLERLVRVLMKEKKLDESKRLLDEVLTAAFVRQPASANLLDERINLLGRQGSWREAASDATCALALQPDDHYRYHTLAVLLAKIHDRPAYEQICQNFLTRFANPINPFIAERMVQDSLLLPHSGVDLPIVDKLADTAVRLGKGDASMPYFQACKAMSDYRLGIFQDAIEWAKEASNSSVPEAQAKAYAVLAMAHWQLGQKDTAHAMLAEGNALVAPIQPGRDIGDMGESWLARLIARISLDEATDLIQSESTTSGDTLK